jgi:dihydropteroate synthase
MIKTKIMGVLNITPNSFSDGGKYLDYDNAIKRTLEMVEAGVDIIDVGAESTRYYTGAAAVDEEIRRLKETLPAIYKLAKEKNILVSLDSKNAETLENFNEYFDIINDVTGLTDTRIIELQKRTNKLAIFMHSLMIPADKRVTIPKHLDPIEYLQNWFENKIKKFKEYDMDLSKLIFDPGIGFGLGPQNDLEVIRRVREFQLDNMKILIAHSRKWFLKFFGEEDSAKRDPETHVLSAYLMNVGVDFIRVHDVESTIRIKKLVKELYK